MRGGAMVAGAVLAGTLAGCAGEPASGLCTPAEVARHCAVATQLFFGLGQPDGTIIADQDWQGFLAEVATPLFPDGFTVLSGEGQWRQQATGTLVREPSRILVLVHSSPDDEQHLAQLIDAYKRRFHQDSVLRLDVKSVAAF